MMRKAFYNALRMQKLQDSQTSAESWQVENYRVLPIEELFQRLETVGIQLDKASFTELSTFWDSPEEFSDALLDSQSEPAFYDQAYLLIFEIWRRLFPERVNLALFCDELDHQIELYDQGDEDHLEELEDALAQLVVILDEQVDDGADSKDVWALVCASCAHDLESFLYDFIAEQIEAHNDSYVSELLEDFSTYVDDVKWFALLNVRLLLHTDTEDGEVLLEALFHKAIEEKDLDFDFEVLETLLKGGSQTQFVQLAEQIARLLYSEGEFLDLLSICAEYMRHYENEQGEKAIQKLIKEHSQIPPENSVKSKKSDIETVLDLLRSSKK